LGDQVVSLEVLGVGKLMKTGDGGDAEAGGQRETLGAKM